MGLNFYENGAAIRPSRVFYDRKHSAFAEADPSEFDFDRIFEQVDWFHVSGITTGFEQKHFRNHRKCYDRGQTTWCDGER